MYREWQVLTSFTGQSPCWGLYFARCASGVAPASVALLSIKFGIYKYTFVSTHARAVAPRWGRQDLALVCMQRTGGLEVKVLQPGAPLQPSPPHPRLPAAPPVIPPPSAVALQRLGFEVG